MKTKERRFAVPFAVFADIDRMPRPAFVILVFLLSKSDFSGWCRITQAEIMAGCNIGDRNTVWSAFHRLAKLGWIEHRRKTMVDTRLQVQVPARLCQFIPGSIIPDNVERMPRQRN